MIVKKGLTFFLLLFIPCISSQAAWVWSPDAGQFVNTEGEASDTAEEQYDYAMRFYRESNFKEAAKQLEQVVKKYPKSRIAPEAQYRLGTILEEQGEYLEAYRAYRVVVESYPQSDRFNEVIEREYRIGNVFLSGQKAKIMGLEILPSLSKAAEIFKHIVEHAPYSEYGDQAQFQLGLVYKQWGHFREAIEAFQTLIDQYPQSPLVSKARFQMAEVSYDKSTVHFRDQRSLDEATRNLDSFLVRHPDSAASEKANKLRQMIDEKNAEKNYRIALYYEQSHYLQSALIYYEDVAMRYPRTVWGEKAQQKLNSIKDPAKYLTGREREVRQQIEIFEEKLNRVPKESKQERKDIEKELEKLRTREKQIGDEKEDTLARRKGDINRRKSELKDKFKNLEKKRKKYKENESEEFQRAMDRWQKSLEGEQEALLEEERQVTDWRESLGVPEKNILRDAIPFIGEPQSELEKVRQIGAKKLYKVSEEKTQVFEEKEALYKQFEEAQTLLKMTEIEKSGMDLKSSAWIEHVEIDEGQVKRQQKEVIRVREEIESLERELEKKKKLYEERFGGSPFAALVRVPAKIVSGSTGAVAKSLSFLNPFHDKQTDMQSLLEKRMHLKEKIVAKQNMTQSLKEAFNQELAIQEQKRLLTHLEDEEKSDPYKIRKSIKKLQKEIRARYQEIEDRHERKKEMLAELDTIVRETEGASGLIAKTGRAVSAPGRVAKSFLFGLPDRGVELTKAAGQLDEGSARGEKAQALKEEIELESLLIEAKSREIRSLEKELEILEAKASLEGGMKFRSAFVKVPYRFIGEAITSAKKIIPRKERDEVLIKKLDEATKELESLQVELKKIESQITLKEAAEGKAMEAADERIEEIEAVLEETSSAKDSDKEAQAMKQEMKVLLDELEENQKVYGREKEILEAQLKNQEMNLRPEAREEISKEHQKRVQKREKEIAEQLEEIRESLTKLIKKESELEEEETSILEKRMSHIDHAVESVKSRATTQDLLTERDRIQERLTQIELRQDFLSKEQERFQIGQTTT